MNHAHRIVSAESAATGARTSCCLALFLVMLAAVPCSASLPDGWTHTTASLPTARDNVGATTLGDTAIFASGSGVDMYDAKSGQWTSASLSRPRDTLAAATLGGCAYFGGGYWWTTEDRVDIYDSASGLWTMDALSVARNNLAAAAVGNKVIFAGGRASNGTPVNTVDIFDMTSGQWSTTHLSQARKGLQAVTVGDRSYFAGGIATSGGSAVTADTIDVYDATTDSWSVMHMPIARAYFGMVAIDDTILFAGGYQITDSTHYGTSHVDILDTKTGMWTSGGHLSGSPLMVFGTTIGDYALFAGNYNKLDIYDTTTGTWYHESFQARSGWMGATSVDGTAFFAGGSGALLDIITVPEPATLSLLAMGGMAIARRRLARIGGC